VQTASTAGYAHKFDIRAVPKMAVEFLKPCGIPVQVNCCCPTDWGGGPPIGKQKQVGSQMSTGCRRMHLLSPNMRRRLLLLVSGPEKCICLVPPGAESLLID
jgi:hypothetical protein